MLGRASLKIRDVVLQASCSPLFSNLEVVFNVFYFKYIQSMLVPWGAPSTSHHPQTQTITFLGQKDRIDARDVALFMTTWGVKNNSCCSRINELLSGKDDRAANQCHYCPIHRSQLCL